jgi:hypothetical protein
MAEDIDINTSEPDEQLVPAIITPRLPPVSPIQSRHNHHRRRREQEEEIESSDDDDDFDINIDVPKPRLPQHNPPTTQQSSSAAKPVDPDEDVSDEDLDDLANELESSLENRPGSSSSEADSDFPAPSPSKQKGPDFNNVPRSGGPISMSRFAGGRRREEESSSSESSDDED